jgi:hypothetical protein
MSTSVGGWKLGGGKGEGRNRRAGSAEKFRDTECLQELKIFCKIKKGKIKEKTEKQIKDERKKEKNMGRRRVRGESFIER